MNYTDIETANKAINAIPIKGKDYAEVNQRIKGFRMVFPDGYIRTYMISNDGGVCIFKAECGYYNIKPNGEVNTIVLGTGTAFERQDSSFINKTSYIENCETSAVGRALGMAGFGIDVSVASYEEVANAIQNQDEQHTIAPEEKKASPKQVEMLKRYYTGADMEKLLRKNGIDRVEDMPISKASEIITKLLKREQANG